MSDLPSYTSEAPRPYRRMSLPGGAPSIVVWNDNLPGTESYNEVERIFIKQKGNRVVWTLSREGHAPVEIDPNMIVFWNDSLIRFASLDDEFVKQYGRLFPHGFHI